MNLGVLFVLLIGAIVVEAQVGCPGTGGMVGICISNCRPEFGGQCGPRQRCCRNGCGGYVCTRVRGGWPWYPGQGRRCPPGSPRLRCFVNPCSIQTCPGVPQAVCRPTNPCEPSCTGAYFMWGFRVPDWMCNRAAI